MHSVFDPVADGTSVANSVARKSASSAASKAGTLDNLTDGLMGKEFRGYAIVTLMKELLNGSLTPNR